MSVPTWSPGSLQQPNALVVPLTAPPVISSDLLNANFEAGNTGWTLEPGWTITNAFGAFDGTWAGAFGSFGPSGPIFGSIRNNNLAPVTPGQSITARAKIYTGTGGGTNHGGETKIFWYDSLLAPISASAGVQIFGGSVGFAESVCTGTAPAGAAFAAIAVTVYRNSGSQIILVDNATWDYTYSSAPTGLIYKAVQADAAYTAATEPIWPTILGNTVIDGGVTWEAVATTRVVWEANPILVTGAVEPIFNTAIGSVVPDNTIGWKAISRRIEDSKCPQSTVVAIASSKVFAGDDDIIGFSATINPLDWSSRNDAGYLPFGLQTYGSTPVTAIGLYRSNLVAFNSASFQMWQVDQDPANMALLDAVPIGCTYPRSIQPLANDLIFLSAVGVRNVGIAGASTNLQAEGIGEPIDVLTIPKIKAGVYEPLSLYYPAAGQYWLIFGDEAFVLTVNGAKKKSWSRYTFPEVITDWTLHGSLLMLRTVNGHVWELDADTLTDDTDAGGGAGGINVDIEGIVWWPHLDCGLMGREKMLDTVELVSDAPLGVYLSIGYDQRNLASRTGNHLMVADTLPGMATPIPVSAPSFDVKLTFPPGQEWEVQAVILNIS